MPKGKKKGRSDRHRIDGSLQTSDDDSFPNDNMSVVSNFSESCSVDDGNNDPEDFAQDQLEDKLTEIIDGLSQKSSQGRTNCFKSFSKALVKKYMPSYIKDRTFTLSDCIERSLKKGAADEKCAAAELATVICVQLGTDPVGEDIFRNLRPILLATACDGSASSRVRGQCCLALGNIAFLSGGDIAENLILMQQLESVFSGSYLKGDGSVPNTTPEVGAMHAAALNAWALLFTLIVPGNIGSLMNAKNLPSLDQISDLLESAHLEVRMAAGEALALVYELGREEDEDFEEDFAVDLIETLKQLATDSHKYRAKKDRKQQRATFRDILLFIEEDTVPELRIKFNKESLVLDTWVKRKQYDALCNILGPSINNHLVENDLIKDIFQIEESEVENRIPAYAQNQMERFKKKVLNAANDKARTLSRAKNRDKRSDF
ncbi:interferon-related developmental regulator 1 [Anthonomus grandis grandis]|uniref:interferon-related developmental regulator 1 n=1 Tax=Anthonomus grandis grandis TaxID=2921223 RepID=UPI0021665272|nr:interferon-related developmental regulator 1 [Anthonomus grandis grandis]